jgi:hypothetical protein
MSKMSNARENHCHTMFVCSFDNFFVAHRTAGLNNRGRADFYRFQ